MGPPTRHSLQTASEPRRGTKTIQPEDPPVLTPEGVLALLRGEIELKYGPRGIRGLPRELSKVASSKIEKTLLRGAYPADVVMAMIRVLVWDWEVARSECFPYRANQSYPCVDSLAAYHKRLAPQVATGFTWKGASRGEWDTYATRYLQPEPTEVDDAPWSPG